MRADSRWRRAGGSMRMCKMSNEELKKVSGDEDSEKGGREGGRKAWRGERRIHELPGKSCALLPELRRLADSRQKRSGRREE